ncbi:hypothetical protein pb186bvf_005862 [Paramecium bursaria]
MNDRKVRSSNHQESLNHQIIESQKQLQNHHFQYLLYTQKIFTMTYNQYYKLKQNDDSLFGLELKFDISQNQLMHINNISETIYPGQILKIPISKLQSKEDTPQRRRSSFIGVNVIDQFVEPFAAKYYNGYYITQIGLVKGLFSIHQDILFFDPDYNDLENTKVLELSMSQNKTLQVQILIKHVQDCQLKILPTRIQDNERHQDQCLQLNIKTQKQKIIFFQFLQDKYEEALQIINYLSQNPNPVPQSPDRDVFDLKTMIPYFFEGNVEGILQRIFQDIYPQSFCSTLQDESLILTQDLLMSIVVYLPAIFKTQGWKLIYSNIKHGSSMKTLFRQTDFQSPIIIIIKDLDNYVFGAYLSDGIKKCCKEQFYGSGESFVFTFKDTQIIEVFKWTTINQDFTLCDTDGIAIGCGDKYGIYINGDLSEGYTSYCDTFANDQLSKNSKFQVKELEIWSI